MGSEWGSLASVTIYGRCFLPKGRLRTHGTPALLLTLELVLGGGHTVIGVEEEYEGLRFA